MTRDWFNIVKMSALGWQTSVEATHAIASLAIAQAIPGDFVECGVYAGAQSALMARAIMDAPKMDRKVHLFDTFDGIPLPGPEDLDLIDNEGGEARCSLPDVKGAMKRWGIPEELLVYHVGLFADTVPAAIANGYPPAIAVLRLDADLYSSTVDALRLYPLVSKGGYIIVDDFNLAGCRKAVLDHFEHAGPAPIMFRKHEAE